MREREREREPAFLFSICYSWPLAGEVTKPWGGSAVHRGGSAVHRGRSAVHSGGSAVQSENKTNDPVSETNTDEYRVVYIINHGEERKRDNFREGEVKCVLR